MNTATRTNRAAALQDFLEEVCRREGIKPPPARFRFRDADYSTGHTYFGFEIVVTAGTNEEQARLVVLHELAHWRTPGHHHDRVFWRTALWLYLCNGFSWEAIHQWECHMVTAHRMHVEVTEG